MIGIGIHLTATFFGTFDQLHEFGFLVPLARNSKKSGRLGHRSEREEIKLSMQFQIEFYAILC